MSPPPLKPLPADIETEVWSICLFATYPVVESCDICEEPETIVVPVELIVPLITVLDKMVTVVPSSLILLLVKCSIPVLFTNLFAVIYVSLPKSL